MYFYNGQCDGFNDYFTHSSFKHCFTLATVLDKMHQYLKN